MIRDYSSINQSPCWPTACQLPKELFFQMLPSFDCQNLMKSKQVSQAAKKAIEQQMDSVFAAYQFPKELYFQMLPSFDFKSLVKSKQVSVGAKKEIEEQVDSIFMEYHNLAVQALVKQDVKLDSFSGQRGLGGDAIYNKTLEKLEITKIHHFIQGFGLENCKKVNFLNLNDFSSIPRSFDAAGKIDYMALFNNRGQKVDNSPLPIGTYFKEGYSPNLCDHFKNLAGVIRGASLYGGIASKMTNCIVKKTDLSMASGVTSVDNK